MQSVDFGLEPFQLFKDEFRNIIYNQNPKKQRNINKTKFEKEHIENFNDPNHCFICKIQPIISKDILEYLFGIKDQKNIPLFKGKILEIIFVGDVFGSVTIYEKINKSKEFIKHKEENIFSYKDFVKSKKKNSYPNKSNLNDKRSVGIENNNNEEEFKYRILTQLFDHYKEIRYIDYNPRLNLFITYSFDGYLNIYTFPYIKMVRVINVEKYTNNNEFKKVALLSNQFAMIFCYNTENYYFFSINGEMLKSEKVEVGEEFYPCVDKYIGLLKDVIKVSKKQGKSGSSLESIITLGFRNK